MSTALDDLNALPEPEVRRRLLACCGSREWARRLAAERPFRAVEDLMQAADRVWRALGADDWREAFAAHPRIGESGTGKIDLSPFSGREQAGVRGSSRGTLERLAAVNRAYEERFGHIFIVCATGRTAAEMLALAEARIHNDPQTELAIAAEEQRKITRLRLAKLLDWEGS